MSGTGIPQKTPSPLASCNPRKKPLDKFLDTDCKSEKINITEAHQFFNQMLYLKPPLPISCFSTLLSALVKCEYFSVAVSFYKRLNVSGRLGLRSNLFILSILVNCYSSMKLGRGAGYAVFGLILKNGYRPDIKVFNSLVKGLCLEEKVVDAVGLVSKAVRLGCAPNVVTYSTVINGLCKTGNVTTALGLHRGMVRGKIGADSYTLIDGGCIKWPRGVRIGSHVVLYNCLIDGLCRSGRDEDAMALLDEMVGVGIRPNVVTNNIVINTLCKKGKMEEAMKLQEMMILRGNDPDVFTYNTMVDGYCSIGKFEAAMDVYKDMCSKGIVADNVTINALLKGLFLLRKVGDAISLFGDVKKMDVGGVCGPNKVTYVIMIDGLCKEGQADKAEELALEMQDNGISLDNHVYSCLIDGLCKQGHVDKAQKLFSEMLASDVFPNVIVYSALISGLCREGDMCKAKELFLQMQKSGILPNVICYSILIDGFYRSGNVEEANATLEKMVEEGILPNAMTFKIMMKNLGKKGEKAARNVIYLMESCGYVCDVASYNALIRGCCQAKNLEDAYNLLTEMEAKGCSPNVETYSTLIRWFACEKESARVKELTRKMHNIRISSNSNVSALVESINKNGETQ